jgi:MerR family transcriptional regulator, heat shock protein HspR
MPIIKINNASEVLGISSHTIRMYEREGEVLTYQEGDKQSRYSVSDFESKRYIRHIINDEKISLEENQRIVPLMLRGAIAICKSKDQKNCEYYSSYNNPSCILNHMNIFMHRKGLQRV